MTPRAACRVTPLKGGRHQQPGEAGSAVPLAVRFCAPCPFCY